MKKEQRPRFLFEIEHVTCGECRHFIRDTIGHMGIGDCVIGRDKKQKRSLYPFTERVCDGFSAIVDPSLVVECDDILDDVVNAPSHEDDYSLINEVTNDARGYAEWSNTSTDTAFEDGNSGLPWGGDDAYNTPKEVAKKDDPLVGIAYTSKASKKHVLPRFN